MQAPSPDPNGRPSPAGDPAAAASSNNGNAGKGSTGSHRTGEPSLSDLLRGSSGSSRRPPSTSDVAAHLANNGQPGPIPDVDDAPTIITQPGRQATGPPSPPPYLVADTASLAGRRLGHFELIEAVGSGGMAAVLKARDLDLGRVVALKILPPESARDAENVTRFKQEARAAAKLDHDNVARVYFCGEDQGLHFIAFEFVEGVTLRALIDRRGPLPAEECVRYMIQVAAGLAHAAERGVVHRDIKPSNILITPDGRAKIVDMGLARHLDGGITNGGVTQSGVTLGTFDYISPEQALDPRRADVRSDIYSLGCAFYHALTRRPPVPEGTAAKKLQAHQSLAPLDPRELNPAIPDDLAAVLARMMLKDPDRRYQSPAELIAHLNAIGDRLHVSVGATGADPVVRSAPKNARILPNPPRLRLGWVVAVAAVAVAAVIIAASTTSPGHSSPPAWAMRPSALPPADPGPAPGGPLTVPPAVAAAGEPVGSDGFVHVTTGADLVRVLSSAKPSTSLRVKLDPGDYDITDHPVQFQGLALELAGPTQVQAGSGRRFPHVRIASSSAKRLDSGGLTVRAAQVTIHDVWFTIVTPSLENGPEATGGDQTGLMILNATEITLADCVFLPDGPPRLDRLAAIGVGPGPEAATVHIHADRCLFGPNLVGLRAPGRSEIAVNDSAFCPHTAAIQLHPDKQAQDAPEPVVTLNRSSFMLLPGSAAVIAEEPLHPKVTAGFCAFALGGGAVEPKLPIARHTAIVHMSGGGPDDIRAIDGRPNAWYRVDLVTTARGISPDESRAPEGGGWIELKQRPWAATGDPLAPFATKEPWRAFGLRVFGPGADPDLFVSDDVVGARFAANSQEGRVYEQWPPPKPISPSTIAQKVWVPRPQPETVLRAGEYTDLVKLLRDVRSGDTILIRHTGQLEIEQQVIQVPRSGAAGATSANRNEFSLTFKPENDHKPILTLAPSDPSMFRVREGRVTFEGIQFQVAGRQQTTVSAVSLDDGRGCTFRRCVFTLEEAEDQTAAVVSLTDRQEMKRPLTEPPVSPKLVFETCLVRGRGRAVWLPVSRPFDLEMKQCVTALNGPVIAAKAGGRDPVGGGVSTVRLTHITALLGGPLIELQAGKVGEMRASGLVPTTVTAEACLFAAVPSAGKPIIEVDGADLKATDRTGVLRWECGEPNRFANFDRSAKVAIVRPGDGDPPHEWDWEEWISFAREVGRPVGRVDFAEGPTDLRDLAGLEPGNVRIKSVAFPDLPDAKASDAGADTEKMPHSTPDENKPERRPTEEAHS